MRGGADIEIGSGRPGETLRAYRAAPAAGHGPGVVVIQEAWGLVEHIRDVCDRLAREGFVALAPDLYRGDSTGELETAGRLAMELEIERATADLDGAVTALLDDDAVDGGRVGMLGFCMGGQLALAAACTSPRVGAVVDCYGVHPAVEPDFAGLAAPVLGVFAEQDEYVSSAAVSELERAIRDAGGRVRFVTYADVQHGFLNDSRPEVYAAGPADRAWGDILSFLRAELPAV